MKITEIKAIASAAPETDMRGVRRNYVYVKISTDEGIVGWGESTCGPLAVANMVEEIGETLIGKDPFRIEQHWQEMYHLWHNVRGGVVQMAAISGIEIALWDIKGKAFDTPVWELIGGQMRDKIWTYGRFDGETPEDCVAHALRETATGLTALKGDPFGHTGLFPSAEAEADSIAKVYAVREAVGPNVELLIECHGRLNPSSAIRFADAVADMRPYVFEEPVPPQNVDAMAKVANAVNVPLSTGERLYSKWDFKDLLEKQVVALIQPDICHVGGISELKKNAAMAEVYYVCVQPHNPYGPINTMAAIQVDVGMQNFMIQEGGNKPWFDLVVEGDFPQQTDGYYDVPMGPGNGINMDEDVLTANPPIELHPPEGYIKQSRELWGSNQETFWG
ncbi:galactonate dehydratase [SAR202 cluster bacterium AD-812-D07_MRT_10900m]|nr:galactonate dehydratase [SAR202 cluster bacterium AD-812-D07_MRT_10900m]